jgi:hypothetical protein
MTIFNTTTVNTIYTSIIILTIHIVITLLGDEVMTLERYDSVNER